MSALSELLNTLSMSAQQAADKAADMGIDLPYGTLAGYWAGNHGKPKRASLAKLAQVVPLTEERLQKAAWGRAAQLGPYKPPEVAMHLTGRQRKAMDELIKSVIDELANEGEDGSLPDPIGDQIISSIDTEVDDSDNGGKKTG